MSTIVLPADPRLRECKPLKRKERPKNKFYVRDRLGAEVLAFEIQGNTLILYPQGVIDKADIDRAFDDLRAFRQLIGL